MLVHRPRRFHARRRARAILSALVATALLVVPGFAAAAPGSARSRPGPVEIHVGGDASTAVTPDRATVVLAVESQADTAPAAQSDNARRVQAVVAALEEAGIGRDAVKTANFRLNPVWSQPTGRSGSDRPVLTGYRVTHDVRVRVPAVDQVGAVIDTAVRGGADRVSHIEFGVGDVADLRDTLLGRAFADARAKAEAIAAAAGLVIAGPSVIHESGMSPFPGATAVRIAADAAFAETAIMPDEQQVTVRVNVTFLAEPAPRAPER